MYTDYIFSLGVTCNKKVSYLFYLLLIDYRKVICLVINQYTENNVKYTYVYYVIGNNNSN